jgi:carbon monoxide dehydrogenase subunit G
MELINEFSVGVPVDRAWAVLTDVETIAPCLPGAQLQEIAGEEYRGVVKVKVGPITANYKGVATFVERDEDARRVVLKADGRETRGQGNASALITAELVPAGASTQVKVTTDLTVSGKVAQFGRGVMADVSSKLMDQFADNLASTVLSGDTPAEEASSAEASAADEARPAPAETPAAPPSDPSAVRVIDSPEATPIDLLDTAGGSVARRVIPAVGILLLLIIVIRVLRRRP